jgi:hypothetical protein
MSSRTLHFGKISCGLVAAALLAACAPTQPADFDPEAIKVHEANALGGAALGQRKQEMQRAVSDMQAFHKTMEGMIARRDSGSVTVFAEFLSRYMGQHLDPILRAEWQSRHAELIDLDVNLRILETSMLIQMRKAKKVERMIKDVQKRYAGRDALLIEYPIGEQSTLGETLNLLRSEMGLCESSQAKWGPGARKSGRGKIEAQPVCMGSTT